MSDQTPDDGERGPERPPPFAPDLDIVAHSEGNRRELRRFRRLAERILAEVRAKEQAGNA